MSRFKPTRYTRLRRSDVRPADEWTGSFTLMLVDNAPLQREAWAEFHSARKRMEKAARELHRHEQTDQPAYDAWLYKTFPAVISDLRRLQQEVSNKARQVQLVQMMATFTGRSHKRLWRELQDGEIDPDTFFSELGGGDEEDDDEFEEKSENEDSEKFLEDEKGAARKRDSRDDESENGDAESSNKRAPASKGSRVSRLAKDIYRRLVQVLHPDRGGEWTDARMRLWHEVQKAWEAGDVDWLSRLEVEWETANDVLGPTAGVGRLRRAIEELDAARRDTEKKLRRYRRAAAWRFTLLETRRDELRRKTESGFRTDAEYLQHQLNYLNATIAAWEKPVGLAAARELKTRRG